MNYPDVTIQICTYCRPITIRKTIKALTDRLTYKGRLRWLICDDHSEERLPGYLAQLAADYPNIQCISTPQNSGWGANVNHGMGKINTAFIFFLEDDYELRYNLDITAGVLLLTAHPGMGYLRYDGIGGHRITASLGEVDAQHFDPDFMQTRGMTLPGRITYWQFHPQSQETWLYSNRPHLKHARFHRYYGMYPEGKKLGETEEHFAKHVKDHYTARRDAPGLGCLPDTVISQFGNIGQSFQHTKEDK